MREEELEEVYGYDDEDVNYWADDDDDEAALTFSTEKATLSGVGAAFGDLTVEQVAVDYRFPVAYVADVITGFGVQPPISDAAVIRDLLDADQAPRCSKRSRRSTRVKWMMRMCRSGWMGVRGGWRLI